MNGDVMSAVQLQSQPFASNDLRQRDKRKNKRIAIEIDGRFLDGDREGNCLITENISCSGALLTSNHRPNPGARIVCYFDFLGRVSGDVVRLTESGFAIRFHTTQHKRDKLADKLIWLLNKEPYNLEEDRNSPRYASGGPAIVRRDNGKDIQCRVMDISLTGASFYTEAPRPIVGEIIKAGNLFGEVVRSEDTLFAVRYLTQMEMQER